MMYKISLEPTKRKCKPDQRTIGHLTNVIGQYTVDLSLREIAVCVGSQGQSFCPAVFHAPKRCEDNYVQQQLFALDFDNGITFDEVKERADELHLAIAFAYHSFRSSEAQEKFRVIFVHEIVVDNAEVAKLIILLLIKIFPECDSRCKDVSRLFCGGKDLFYYDEREPCFDIASLASLYQLY